MSESSPALRVLFVARVCRLFRGRVVDPELGAGDVALYDGRCLHAGDTNTSPRQSAESMLFYCSFATAEHARTSTRGTILDDLRGKHALSDWREWMTWSSSEDCRAVEFSKSC